MKLAALLMAGGRGRRLKTRGEKPLLPLLGRPMAEYVVEALRASEAVNRVVAVTSPQTPQTTASLKAWGLEVFVAPGLGFVEDYRLAARRLRLTNALVVSADLPLLTGGVVDEAVRSFTASGKDALAVCVDEAAYRRMGLDAEGEVLLWRGMKVAPIGLNVVNALKIEAPLLSQEVLLLGVAELGINVNKPGDRKIAEGFLREKQKKRLRGGAGRA